MTEEYPDGICRRCGGYAHGGYYCDLCMRDMEREEDGDDWEDEEWEPA